MNNVKDFLKEKKMAWQQTLMARLRHILSRDGVYALYDSIGYIFLSNIEEAPPGEVLQMDEEKEE